MLGFIIQRILQAALVMLAMSALVFVGVYAIGNPIDVIISPDATQDIRAQAIARYGLDRPLWEQYFVFIGNLLRGDFGRSFLFGMPVIDLILTRLPATLELTLIAVLAATLLGVPLGIYAGYRPDSGLAKGIMAASILGFSVPTFWIGLILILTFSVRLGWLPAIGRGDTVEVLGLETSMLTLDGLRHLAMPAFTLSLVMMAMVIRLTRAGMREVMHSDYIRFARANGIRERRVIGVHALKNILIPIVTVLGMEFGGVIAFAVVTESIFSWPGVGKMLIDAIAVLDRPLIVAYLIFVVAMFVALNLFVDIVYSFLDPRVRVGGAT
jgi:peptide/nickel transport system permease protein